ncbi:arabinosylfuranosidase ArfA [Cellulomonas fengjieae]|uniref:non-reducing end alpha-L-arabinofuranosidase n=1 Tax=Cellulomonas fengjieae TaxID=2819978 RepID=A0ABS3SD55_9CELL|nr:alpha-N-arabinofuranosidase [Cellulomonas fengjieae]MBO3083254.1 alpha-N-arabinofuranosidase [Cellulomonas fengjieae]MBO3101998.1 alpha-N-arabinofuranosidase [Cellulomonas fengjieae]QVI65393.1 alpha-N-arabinofuranosidase [Cellulomonas fengjieae]
MSRARVTLDRDFVVGEVPPRIFGSFVEHMGRCVYTGIYEPGHPTADAQGYRGDVLDLVKELGATVVRYPGGNFVSGYDWEDGVGQERPRRLDGAWHTVETNAFGLHEFVDWARLAGVEVMEAVNLGTRGVQEARALVEYANHPGGTELSDRRRKNGHDEPFDIRLWCLGNEMDGPWQMGAKTADEYGRLAAEAAKAMRLVDPSIELVACGSSNSGMPTFGAWEQTVLGHTYDEVDYVSLHAYYQEHDGDHASFLASAADMDYFIESVVATADAVRAKGKHKKRIDLSFDEWNVWYATGKNTPDQPHVIERAGVWREHPRIIEDEYSVTDAVVVGTFLNSLLRHGDRVKIANQAQLVNVIAPIRSEEAGPAWRQSIFWPFARTAALARGTVLRAAVTSDRYDTARFGGVDLVDVSATWDEERGRVALFLAHRGLDDEAEVGVDLRGWAAGRVTRAEVLAVPEGGDRHTTNTQDAPDRVGLAPLDGVRAEDGTVSLRLPPLSWSVVELEVTLA